MRSYKKHVRDRFDMFLPPAPHKSFCLGLMTMIGFGNRCFPRCNHHGSVLPARCTQHTNVNTLGALRRPCLDGSLWIRALKVPHVKS
mmetsp:Transcript_20394/g.36520  ORF Transcript_20394/g.36520 Transcript_20394/m.36520 type:complete len:87 (+) Transcript_20394:285-545(+)